MVTDLGTRIAGSSANPPVGQDLTGATTAGLLSTNYMELKGPRDFDSRARSLAEGEELCGKFTFTASLAAASANLTVELRLVALPRTSLTMPTFSDANVSAANDLIAIAAHGFENGTALVLSNSGGALPAGLAASTHYYVVNKTTDTFQLSLTPGGAVVDITAAAGGGTHTATFLPTVVGSSGPVPAKRLKAGDRVQVRMNPLPESLQMPRHRFLFGMVVPSATLTAGGLTLDIGTRPDAVVSYPSGFVA